MNLKKLIIPALGIVCVLFLTNWLKKNEPKKIKIGLGKLHLKSHSEKNRPKIKVWYYRPENWNKERILFVIHGTKRNAKDYLNHWIEFADSSNVLVLAPEFKRKHVSRRSAKFNEGNVIDRNNNVLPEKDWTFTIIENAFDQIVERTNSPAKEYDIFGHSAGAQFVHRMILNQPDSRIRNAVSANAGWYTFPDTSQNYPYGMGNEGLTEIDYQGVFSKQLVIMLGAADTSSTHWALRNTEKAIIQGRNRLERGSNFFNYCSETSSKEGVLFNWKLDTIQEVGHSFSRMSNHASKYFAW